MIVDLIINLESAKFFKVCEHFGGLDIKVLKCQAYLKAVAYIITGETRL